MKKIVIFIFIAVMLCSCGVSNTITKSYYGKVTTFTPQGDTLNIWDNACIEETTVVVNNLYGVTSVSSVSSFKSFGLNFIDLNTNKGIVIHSGIPYVIEYNTDVIVNENKNEIDNNGDAIKEKYINLQREYKNKKKELKNYNKNSDVYYSKKKELEILKKEIGRLGGEYFELTGEYIYSYEY